MAGKKRGSRGPRGGDNGAHWISYSDMMASLLLVFVLAVVYSVYQYYSMLELKTQQLNEQKAELDKATITLVEREKELEEVNVTLMGREEELATIQIQLQKQEDELHAAQTALKTEKDEQALLQLQLQKRDDDLRTMSLVLENQRIEMQTQQKKIDALLGVRTMIIEDLSRELSRSNLRATVDKTTGDIMLDSAIFFDSNKNTVKPEGQDLLRQFIPVYLGVLMRDEYRDFVGEIIIEGHTDTSGSYMTNLKLSQDRALSVAEFCLNLDTLGFMQKEQFKDLMTVKGRSYSDPIYNADGTVNMNASRRVEFKFRLKDSEMIEEMNRILTQIK